MSPTTVNTIDANVAIVRRLIEEGFSKGNLEVVEELISPDCVEHQRGNGPGVDGARRVVSTLHSWFSDFRLEIQDLVAHDDTVWIRNRATGTNTGHFMGFEPTKKQIDITVFDLVRIEDGRIVEHWGVADQLGVALQLGLITPPGRPGADRAAG
jgi:predicted ester cyclase